MIIPRGLLFLIGVLLGFLIGTLNGFLAFN